MPTSTERGKGKGRGRKRKAVAVDVNPVEPENCMSKSADQQHGSPALSQRYVPRFTTKSKRARVSSSEVVPVTEMSETADVDQDALATKESHRNSPPRTQTPIPEAELQAVEQVQQTETEIQAGALDESSQVHLDDAGCERSEVSVNLVPGLALSQSTVTTSSMLQHHHGDGVVLPSDQDGSNADNKTPSGLREKQFDQQELHSCNEQITVRNLGYAEDLETGGAPVQNAAGHEGRNLELLDLMGGDDDDDDNDNDKSEAIGNMKQASVGVEEFQCMNAVDLEEVEAGETADGVSLQTGTELEPVCDGRQIDFHIIQNNSQGNLVDIAVPSPGQSDQSETLQLGSTFPDATLPDSQEYDLVPEAQESLYSGDNCGSRKKNNSIILDDKNAASLTLKELNSPAAETQTPASFGNTLSSQVPSVFGSSTTDTVVQSHESEASAAVRELMDIAAADLLESQLGCFRDEATVPSCSPASKKLTSKPPSCRPPPWLQKPADPGFSIAASTGSGASSGTQSGRKDSQDEGTGILRGLIEELSALNRFIMNCKRELGSARKQRSSWLKSQRGRRGR